MPPLGKPMAMLGKDAVDDPYSEAVAEMYMDLGP